MQLREVISKDELEMRISTHPYTKYLEQPILHKAILADSLKPRDFPQQKWSI